MKGEIEIFKNEDEIVEFGIHDTEFRVCIETETILARRSSKLQRLY